MIGKYNSGNNSDQKIQKEFQSKSEKIKKAFAESRTDEELVSNMGKIGFAYFDDDDEA